MNTFNTQKVKKELPVFTTILDSNHQQFYLMLERYLAQPITPPMKLPLAKHCLKAGIG